MPVGALCGPSRIMQNLAPLGGVYQAGTLSGNPVSLAAGIATLEVLSDGGAYKKLEDLGEAFDRKMKAEASDLPFLHYRRLGSVLWMHLAEGPVPRRADAIRPESADRFNRMHGLLLDRGIYLAPSAYEVTFFSTAHSRQEVEELAVQIAVLFIPPDDQITADATRACIRLNRHLSMARFSARTRIAQNLDGSRPGEGALLCGVSHGLASFVCTTGTAHWVYAPLWAAPPPRYDI